jgi:hypothetical protein
LRRDWLDEELSYDTDPAVSSAFSVRAARLRSRTERSRLANALTKALGDARGANLDASSLEARRQNALIREQADVLQALIDRLRDDNPIRVHGVRGAAVTAQLVNDASSPLHRIGGQDLRHEICAARFALDE